MLNNWVSDVRFEKGDVESAYTWNDGTGLFTTSNNGLNNGTTNNGNEAAATLKELVTVQPLVPDSSRGK